MTECLAYNPQNNFASVIENINRELREKGEFIIFSFYSFDLIKKKNGILFLLKWLLHSNI